MKYISKVILQLTFLVIVLIIGIFVSKEIINWEPESVVKIFFWWLLFISAFYLMYIFSNYWTVNSIRNKTGPQGTMGESGPAGPQGPPGVCTCPANDT
jgi:uncharacterized membrane protein YfcA